MTSVPLRSCSYVSPLSSMSIEVITSCYPIRQLWFLFAAAESSPRSPLQHEQRTLPRLSILASFPSFLGETVASSSSSSSALWPMTERQDDFKTPFLEKWERDIVDDLLVTQQRSDSPQSSSWNITGDFDDMLLAPHSTTVVPPVGYSDFIKEGLKDAGLLIRDPSTVTTDKDLHPHAPPPAAAATPNPAEDAHRKGLHNATEKRRREKINAKLAELRDAIPHAAGPGANKTTVLRATVDHIRSLNQHHAQLQAINAQLQETNQQLLNQLRDMHRVLWMQAREWTPNQQQQQQHQQHQQQQHQHHLLQQLQYHPPPPHLPLDSNLHPSAAPLVPHAQAQIQHPSAAEQRDRYAAGKSRDS